MLSYHQFKHAIHYSNTLDLLFTTHTRRFATKRPHKSLSKRTSALTTRDRQRKLVETNLIDNKVLDRARVKKLINSAKDRLSFFQQKLYGFWNSDYKEANQRPVKQVLVMDIRWWIWNIIFGLTPGILFAIYAEFWGIHIVHDYYESLEIARVKEQFGEDYVEANLDKFTTPPPRNIVQRVYDSYTELKHFVTIIFSQQQVQDEGEKDEKVNDSLIRGNNNSGGGGGMKQLRSSIVNQGPLMNDIKALKEQLESLQSEMDRIKAEKEKESERRVLEEAAAASTAGAAEPVITMKDVVDASESKVENVGIWQRIRNALSWTSLPTDTDGASSSIVQTPTPHAPLPPSAIDSPNLSSPQSVVQQSR
jgi:hypothetical protein